MASLKDENSAESSSNLHTAKDSEATSSASASSVEPKQVLKGKNSAPEVTRKRRKNRRKKAGGRHHKWKPYDKLTSKEKQERDERQERRAKIRYESQLKEGKPMAPFNTNSFLMEQYDGSDHKRSPCLDPGSPGSSDSAGDAEARLQADFNAEFTNVRSEELLKLSKTTLILKYLELERHNDELEQLLLEHKIEFQSIKKF